ncbi:MAG: nucleotide-diphospho-sugar transferase [Candidatus Omnitrophica bacterium]|nr:nucleotide-diphospho-sugar transferase [Candidatus Omnitrophota bacterium]
MFDVPILFIIFRRKDTALKVIDAIAKVKPKKLYISQDGPRNENEKGEILAVREAVLSRINWSCDLKFWCHKKNLAIAHQYQALKCFLEEEEYGIYLEDDTVPSVDFFYFQKELLNKYKNDNRIFLINGTNLFHHKVNAPYSYYLSRICSAWGFGIWRRSFKHYDYFMRDLSDLEKDKNFNKFFFSKKFRFYLFLYWTAIKKGKLKAFDFQFYYAAAKSGMQFIMPSKNLVKNIGFVSDEGSHPFLVNYSMNFGRVIPIKHPSCLDYKPEIDRVYFDNLMRGGWLRLFLISIYIFMPDFIKLIIERIILFMNKSFASLSTIKLFLVILFDFC